MNTGIPVKRSRTRSSCRKLTFSPGCDRLVFMPLSNLWPQNWWIMTTPPSNLVRHHSANLEGSRAGDDSHRRTVLYAQQLRIERPLAAGASRRYLQGSGILLAESLMRRTLVILLSIWAFAAPAACLALCPEPSTAAESGSVTAEPAKPPCHQTAPGDRSPQNPESAPESNDGCCLERQPTSIQASAPEPPRAPLVFAFRATSKIVDAAAPTIVSSLLREASCIRTPYPQTNPPLLI